MDITENKKVIFWIFVFEFGYSLTMLKYDMILRYRLTLALGSSIK
jgi:hypothetical protein